MCKRLVVEGFRLRQRSTGLLVGLSLALLLGCGGPDSLPVEGTVVFNDGEPVRTGRIEYNAVSGPFRAMGEIDDAGRFELITAEGDKGLPAGEYEIIVVQLVITEDLSLADHDHGRAVPRKYADYSTSGLRTVISEANSTQQEVVVEAK